MSAITLRKTFLSAVGAIAGALAVLMAVGLLGGCGGGETAGYDITPNDGFPRTIYFTPVLKVVDDLGDPLPGATVWIEDAAEPPVTSPRWVALGDGYPADWIGRKANWIGPIYDVVLRKPTDSPRVHVEVTAPGYNSDTTYFDINSTSPSRLFGYDTLQLTRPSGVESKPAQVSEHHRETAGGPPVQPGAQTRPLPQR